MDETQIRTKVNLGSGIGENILYDHCTKMMPKFQTSHRVKEMG